MEAEAAMTRMPPLLLDPKVIESIIRRRTPRKVRELSRSHTIPEMDLLPIALQLGREHLDALREEINAAEPVLTNLYQDLAMFNIRQRDLNNVVELLIRMREAVDHYPFSERDRGMVKQEIDHLVSSIQFIVSQSKYYSIPLLQPMRRVAPPAFSAPRNAGNVVDIVFIISRSDTLRRDIKLLATYLPDFYFELANSGLDIRFGLQTYGRTSQPSGPFRATPDEFIEDLRAISFENENQNTLTALQNTVDDFSYRIPSHRFFVLLTDQEAHDDFGDARDRTLQALKDNRVTLFSMSVNDYFTRQPLAAFDSIARATGGAYINIEKTDYRATLSELCVAITDKVVSTGATVVWTEQRTIPLGPEIKESIPMHCPDFNPASLGLEEMKLETLDDFREACSLVEKAINVVAVDMIEKRVLHDYLDRILSHFDYVRNFRLDFRI